MFFKELRETCEFYLAWSWSQNGGSFAEQSGMDNSENEKKNALSLSETIEGKISVNKGERFVVLIGHVLR